jgi:hypothetical protein
MSDDRSPEAVQQGVVGALQQVVIDDVMRQHSGESATAVLPALRQAFSDAGLACPPRPWLGAAAAEIAAGRRLVVGTGAASDDPATSTADDGADDSRPRRGASSDSKLLWFSHDPKIGHIPWTEAVEHPAEQFGES